MVHCPLRRPVSDSVKYYRPCQASPNQKAHPVFRRRNHHKETGKLLMVGIVGRRGQKPLASKGCSELLGQGWEQGAALFFTTD
jgi:hypothetical protein